MENIILNYWAQFTLFIGVFFTGIGYILKIVLEWKVKKSEIKYSLFYNRKIQVVDEFVLAFRAYEKFFKDVGYWDVKAKKFTAKEMDVMIEPFKSVYQKSFSILTLYLDKKGVSSIKEIDEGILICSAALNKLYFSNTTENDIIATNEYQFSLDKGMFKIENGYAKFSEHIKKDFK